jgi:hypothetical protein
MAIPLSWSHAILDHINRTSSGLRRIGKITDTLLGRIPTHPNRTDRGRMTATRLAGVRLGIDKDYLVAGHSARSNTASFACPLRGLPGREPGKTSLTRGRVVRRVTPVDTWS